MKTIKAIGLVLYNVYGFLKSVFVLLFRSIKKPAILHGYCVKWFAHNYRVKRELFWHNEWDQMGRKQFILPFRPGMWIVCSRLELAVYQKKGLISPRVNIKKFLKRSL